MIPIALEKWLTDEGDRVVRKAATTGVKGLGRNERLVYEIWLFDTEQRNGGVSQYFCNRGSLQWNTLVKLVLPTLGGFAQFADAVNQVVDSRSDAYQAVIGSDIDLDRQYEACRGRLITELMTVCQS